MLKAISSNSGGGGGAVSSVSNSDGSLVISPTTGDIVASINTANSNTFSVTQTINTGTSATPCLVLQGFSALADGYDQAVLQVNNNYGENIIQFGASDENYSENWGTVNMLGNAGGRMGELEFCCNTVTGDNRRFGMHLDDNGTDGTSNLRFEQSFLGNNGAMVFWGGQNNFYGLGFNTGRSYNNPAYLLDCDGLGINGDSGLGYFTYDIGNAQGDGSGNYWNIQPNGSAYFGTQVQVNQTSNTNTNGAVAYGYSDGGYNAYSQIAWYSNSTGNLMGRLNDDGGGNYGSLFLCGNRNTQARLSEWDTMDSALSADQRCFTMHVEYSSGYYWMGWNPLGSDGNFQDNTFSVWANSTGVANGGVFINGNAIVPISALDIGGTKGLAVGSGVAGVTAAPTNGILAGGSIKSNTSFVLSGGTSSQFLKADGSTDSNNYLPYKAKGTATLASGTKAITISGVSTSNEAFVQLTTPSGTLGAAYKAVCTTNTLTITAVSVAGVTVTTDTSTLNYLVI